MDQVIQLVKQNDTSTFMVEGYVTAKRSLGAFFGFVDILQKDGGGLVQLMLKRQDYYRKEDLKGMLKAMNPGTHVRVKGIAAATRNPGEGVVLVHKIDLLGLPPNPQHVEILLRLVSQETLDASQVAPVLNMTIEELSDRMKTAWDNDKSYDGLAKELLLLTRDSSKSTPDLVSTDGRKPFLPVAPFELVEPPFQREDITERPPLLFGSVSDLNERLDELNNDGSDLQLVALEGWVQNRRRFHNSITVLKVADTFAATQSEEMDTLTNGSLNRIQCVLHPKLLLDNVGHSATTAADKYGALLSAGSRVLLEGYLIQGEDQTPTLWATSIRLLRCSWRPTVVRYLLELLVGHEFNTQEAAVALNISLADISQLQKLDLTERQWRATEISQKLQDSHTRMTNVSPGMISVLDDFQELRKRYPIYNQDVSATSTVDDTFLSTNEPGTWWQRNKRPQLEFMAQQIQAVVQAHPDYGTRKLSILDVGGGKGVLANYLAKVLGDDVFIKVIDIASGAVKNGMMRAKRLDLPTVKFCVGDASLYNEPMDVVVALHACGTLSDVALSHAVNHGASFVVCPCCFRSNPHLKVPIMQQDSIEGTEFLSAQEWLGVSVNAYETMKLLAEVQGDTKLASEAMHTICAMRAAAVQRHAQSQVRLNVEIKTFPISFSTRNFCLVGTRR